ncbi:MAG: hypothetical protein JSS72_04065 [Armatimonadetes bacterium]|nr:hypothetical protein [Armatimonadota bacterium]
MYEPLRELCCTLISSNARLKTDITPSVVISSEWDYSPLYFQPTQSLLELVILGIPACESDNALLFPLMGHEVGHVFWQRIILYESLDGLPFAEIKMHITAALYSIVSKNWNSVAPAILADQDISVPLTSDEIAESKTLRKALSPLEAIVQAQAEETFCDFLGIRLFPSSYLEAFTQYLAPGTEPEANQLYPSWSLRIQNMVCAANHYDFSSIPRTFLDHFGPLGATSDLRFTKEPFPLRQRSDFSSDLQYMCHVAEVVVSTLSETLAQAANLASENAKIPMPDQENITTIERMLRADVPGCGSLSLGNLLDAAWRIHSDLLADLAAINPNAEDAPHQRSVVESKAAVLREAVLKSLEVLSLEKLAV